MEIQFLEHELFCARESLKNSTPRHDAGGLARAEPGSPPPTELAPARDVDFSRYLAASVTGAATEPADPPASLALASAIQCAAALVRDACDERRRLLDLAADARARLAEVARVVAERDALRAEAARLAEAERAHLAQDARRRREAEAQREALTRLQAQLDELRQELAARDAEVGRLRGYCEALALAAETGPVPAFETPAELEVLQRALTRGEAEAAALQRRLAACERRAEAALKDRARLQELAVNREQQVRVIAAAAAAGRRLAERAAGRERRARAGRALRAWGLARTMGRMLAGRERSVREEEGEVRPFPWNRLRRLGY